MPNEMNHVDLADKLESTCWVTSEANIQAINQAAADERRIANGELVEVVHAHWICKYEPNEDCMGGSHYVKQCSACGENYEEEYDYCPSCGALMGEDDSHETN